MVYGREKAERALQNFFRESTLVALREMALRQTAHEVEHRSLAETGDAWAGHGGSVTPARITGFWYWSPPIPKLPC